MSSSLESVAVANLLLLARACAAARAAANGGDCTLRTISRLCHGDGPALDKLADGTGSLTLRKYDEAMGWLRDRKNWPKDVAIPKAWEPWRRGGAPR